MSKDELKEAERKVLDWINNSTKEELEKDFQEFIDKNPWVDIFENERVEA